MNGNMNLGKRVTALEKDGGADIKKEISVLKDAVATTQSEIDVLESKVNSGHVYSTEEQIVGTWIDGKHVYEKTLLHDGVISQDTEIFKDESIEEFIDVFNKYFYDANFSYWCSMINGEYELNIISAGKSLKCNVDSAYSNRITKCRCTIQYTKTTDTLTT